MNDVLGWSVFIHFMQKGKRYWFLENYHLNLA
jgi:hypothetical protein